MLPTLDTLEECLVRFVQAAQRILQDLTEYASNIRSNRFDIRQLVDLAEDADRSAIAPRSDPFC